MTTVPRSAADDLARLRKIEGQIQGVQKMIGEGRYCIDVLTQIGSVVGALKSVEENILDRHLRTCVRESLSHGTPADQDRKIEEIVSVLGRFRKHG
jgi:CsoR family transcriptional regulator, copper-sensing transcriptional repressor